MKIEKYIEVETSTNIANLKVTLNGDDVMVGDVATMRGGKVDYDMIEDLIMAALKLHEFNGGTRESFRENLMELV